MIALFIIVLAMTFAPEEYKCIKTECEKRPKIAEIQHYVRAELGPSLMAHNDIE